jgi:hypothetical protein
VICSDLSGLGHALVEFRYRVLLCIFTGDTLGATQIPEKTKPKWNQNPSRTIREPPSGSVALTGDIVQFGGPRDAKMTKPIARDLIYRRRRFDAEVIELCVRWYITYRLSYRDLVAMVAERGIAVRTPPSSVGYSLCTGV